MNFQRVLQYKSNVQCSLIFRGIDNEFHSYPCRRGPLCTGCATVRVHPCLVTPCSWRTQKRYIRRLPRALAALQHQNQSSKVFLTCFFTLAASSIRRFSACAPRVCEWVRSLRMHARVRPRMHACMHAPSIPVRLCVCTARRVCT